jgi:hypothetical protein
MFLHSTTTHYILHLVSVFFFLLLQNEKKSTLYSRKAIETLFFEVIEGNKMLII